MKTFEDAFALLMDVERGYWNDPVGGPTMYGVTEKVARAHGYAGDMRALTLPFAKAVAKADYWDRYQCDQFDPRIAYQVFDTAYNGGYPVRWLQECVGVTADGVIGAKTIAAVRQADVWRIIALFNAKRQLYQTSLNNWPQNSRGWAIRIAKNMLTVESQ